LRTFVILIICSILALVPASAADLQSEGAQYFRARDFAKALDCFNAALKQQPNDWKVMQSIASCHNRLGHFDTAVGNLQKSIEVGGLHASQCTIMAGALEGLGQPKQALHWLQLACSLEPAQAMNPTMQAAIRRLKDPLINPSGSPSASDYMDGLVSVYKWRKNEMPIKVYVRKNYQLPGFYDQFVTIVRDSVDQWCDATKRSVTYIFVNALDSANLVYDYTDRRELCSSDHEPGLEGGVEMKIRSDDKTPVAGNIVILVKDGPNALAFRDPVLINKACLHETGHALGLHGHSANNNDVMFLAATPKRVAKLSQRDKNTMRKIYESLQ
jgi:tetratricopeptide (TPR) repeat protein